MAALMASFIMHKPRQKSSFTKAALKTLESIEALDQFIVKHRKDYVDLHRTTEQERDSIEHEVSVFIKACKEQIDILKNRMNDEDNNGNSRAWLGMRGDNSHTDMIAHKHGVVLILSERLHSVTAQFDQLRAVRFQDAINRAIPRRKLHRVVNSNSPDVAKSNHSEFHGPDEISQEPLRSQQQLLDDETRALQVELASVLDAVQETETKMVEMSALNHLMSTHVLQQAQQIEVLYEQLKLQRTWIWATKSSPKLLNATAVAGPFFCFFYLSSHFPSSFWIGTVKQGYLSRSLIIGICSFTMKSALKVETQEFFLRLTKPSTWIFTSGTHVHHTKCISLQYNVNPLQTSLVCI